jgi:hypothetical protein
MRTSFLDLPPEIRNIICNLEFPRDGHKLLGWKLHHVPDQDRFRSCYPCTGLQEAIELLKTLESLSAVSKEMRADVRCWFYSHSAIHLVGSMPEDMDRHGLADRYLKKISLDGCTALLELKVDLKPAYDFGHGGCSAFTGLLSTLTSCKNLRSLAMDLHVPNLFYSDLPQLRARLIDKKGTDLPGLNDFASVISSLPNLQELFIEMMATPHSLRRPAQAEEEDFRLFAFSGIRQTLL